MMADTILIDQGPSKEYIIALKAKSAQAQSEPKDISSDQCTKGPQCRTSYVFLSHTIGLAIS